MDGTIVAVLGFSSQQGQDAVVCETFHHGGAADLEKDLGRARSLNDVRRMWELQPKRG